MYGNWQLGHMPLEEYMKKHNSVVDTMRQVDPTFKPIAVGARGRWSQQMLTTCADHMSLISEHLYWQDRDDVISHVRQIADRIRDVAEAHRGYRNTIASLAGKDIRIAMDEWNYWYGPNEYGFGTFFRMALELRLACMSSSVIAIFISWPTTHRPSTLLAPLKLLRLKPNSKPQDSY